MTNNTINKKQVYVIASLLTHVFCLSQGQDNNVRLGPSAGASINNTGAANVMIGQSAGFSTTGGIVNVMIGNQTGANTTTGNYNTFIGNGAGAGNINGNYNTCIGDGAGYSLNASANMFLGVHAGFSTTSGANNVMIGGGAGGNNTVGSNNILIGNSANVASGDLQNATAIGTNAVVALSNSIVLGSSNVNVGIGVSAPNPAYKLVVNGKVAAREINVTTESWSDFVFNNNYKLRSLTELALYIKKNHHLPEIPSEKEVLENGIDLGTINQKLLQKIEEITLYMIRQDKQIKTLTLETKRLKGLLLKSNRK